MKIIEAIATEGGRVTLGMLSDLARGAGGGAFGVGGRSGKGKSKEKVGLDLETVCRGKVDMSRDVSWLFRARLAGAWTHLTCLHRMWKVSSSTCSYLGTSEKTFKQPPTA